MIELTNLYRHRLSGCANHTRQLCVREREGECDNAIANLLAETIDEQGEVIHEFYISFGLQNVIKRLREIVVPRHHVAHET